MPRLNPIVLVASGPTVVSVATTEPPVKVKIGCSVVAAGLICPVNVSVVIVVVGVVGVVVLLPQPPASAAMAQSRVPRAIRRSISSPNPSDRLLDFQWPALV